MITPLIREKATPEVMLGSLWYRSTGYQTDMGNIATVPAFTSRDREREVPME